MIRDAPGENAVAKALPAAWKRHLTAPIPIALLATRRVGSDTWLHLRIEGESCDQVLPGVKPMEGWIPAYRPSGKTTAWFTARGC